MKKLLVGGGVLLAGGSIAYATGMFDGEKEEEEPSNAVPGEPWMWGVGALTIGGGFAFWKWGWPRLRDWYWPPPTGPDDDATRGGGANGQTEDEGATQPGQGANQNPLGHPPVNPARTDPANGITGQVRPVTPEDQAFQEWTQEIVANGDGYSDNPNKGVLYAELLAQQRAGRAHAGDGQAAKRMGKKWGDEDRANRSAADKAYIGKEIEKDLKKQYHGKTPQDLAKQYNFAGNQIGNLDDDMLQLRLLEQDAAYQKYSWEGTPPGRQP